MTRTQPVEDCYKSDDEKPPHSELPVSSNGLVVYDSPSEFPVPVPENTPLLCSLDLA